MTLLFLSTSDDPQEWSETLRELLPELEVRVWPEIGDPMEIEAALVWKPPPGVLKAFPNLKLIQSLGMGVDHIFQDPELPPVPVARLVDKGIIQQMAEYVTLMALDFHRRGADYRRLQDQARWQPLPPPDTRRCSVGVMGLGAIGAHTARVLRAVGFPVVGYSLSPRALEGMGCFAGPEGLQPFLERSRILVCLLPLTPDTEDILNGDTLGALPRGAWLINCARGGHLVEADLLAALDRGQLAGAALDVFRQEPLPPEHPFWHHPAIRITPHVAGLTTAASAAPQVAENLRRLWDGRPLLNRVDPHKGY